MWYQVCFSFCFVAWVALAGVATGWSCRTQADSLYYQGEKAVQQAQRLNRDLTPLGAERAGNGADIPPWRGGLAMPPLAYKGVGHRRPDPYPDDQPVYQIYNDNSAQHQLDVTPGVLALLRGSDVQLNVYPTRRTAAAPHFWYDQTYQNLVQRPDLLTDLTGGVPFPIPSDGSEVLTNMLLRWQGKQFHGFERLFSVQGNDVEAWPLATRAVFPYAMPVSDRGFDLPEQLRSRTRVSESNHRKAVHWFSWRERSLESPFHRQYAVTVESRAVAVEHLLNASQAPAMLPPSLLMDQPDQYHWQLVGKRELLVPYNNYRLFDDQPGYKNFLTPSRPQLQRVRFEKHRVWVLDGVVKGRSRASFGKQVLYVDEDSWAPVMIDRYSIAGELVGVGIALLTSAYEVPAIVAEFQLEFDLQEDRYWFHAMDDSIGLSRDYSRLPVSRNRSLLDTVR